MCLMESPRSSSQCLQNPSSDIRLVAEKMIWWANKDPLPALDPQAIKPILKALLDNTKDKNTVVKGLQRPGDCQPPQDEAGRGGVSGGSLGLAGLPTASGRLSCGPSA